MITRPSCLFFTLSKFRRPLGLPLGADTPRCRRRPPGGGTVSRSQPAALSRTFSSLFHTGINISSMSRPPSRSSALSPARSVFAPKNRPAFEMAQRAQAQALADRHRQDGQTRPPLSTLHPRRIRHLHAGEAHPRPARKLRRMSSDVVRP